jgi:hypothetical protein
MPASRRHTLALLAAALWWGSLSALGALVVPALFAHLPTPALAGQTAAKLFSLQAHASAVLAGVVLICLKADLSAPKQPNFEQNRPFVAGFVEGNAIFFALTGLLLALLLEYAVSPRIAAKENLALWHKVGTALFAVQWAMALLALLGIAQKPQTKPQSRPESAA